MAILGVLLLFYVLPEFMDAWEIMKNTDKDIDPNIPPQLRQVIEYQIKKVYEEFYKWTIFLALAFILLLVGVYLSVRRKEHPTRPPRKRPRR